MTQPPPTRLVVEPPIDQWRVTPRNGRSTPVIATGHQPYFWHPGILAKYIAADVFATLVEGATLYVVVDHNPIDPLAIDVPVLDGDAIQLNKFVLDRRPEAIGMPPNRLKMLDPSQAAWVLRRASNGWSMPDSVRNGVTAIAQHYTHTGPGPHLAAHTTTLLSQLSYRFRSQSSDVFPKAMSTSTLITQCFVERLLADPVGCVRYYNRATLAYPEARIRPLYLGRDVVEAPLWAQDESTCTPVYIDLGDSRRPHLFTVAHNRHLDLSGADALRYLRPRAITLSAIMRSEHCDLFIHGTGGGVYDQVTERWWNDWAGEELAPKAVVSADVHLPFGVPVATRAELRRAVWFEHHLPYNIERFTGRTDAAEAALVREKQNLLDRMNDDRDKRRRSAGFRRIHAINAELQSRHAGRISRARREAERARVGVGNAVIAARRDWCFALYPDESIAELRRPLEEALAGRNRMT